MVWIVGQFLDEAERGVVWELAGVFTDEARAVAACRDCSYFVGPLALDAPLPHETTAWAGAYYPLAADGLGWRVLPDR